MTWPMAANFNTYQMFKNLTLDFKSAGTLNQLVLDYLSKKEILNSFYSFFPDKQGFSGLLKTNSYSALDRSLLSTILLKQSQSVKNTTELSVKNISLLTNKNTFTVTTGHQLCLFTGPLYFIYKIFSAINLAEELKKDHPGSDFIPVYWMASEDHDFEEVSSFLVNGRSVKWNSGQTGAVGDFKTSELKTLMPQLREALGISENSAYLIELFEKAYLKHTTLADATRFLVNELFGKYGLVTIDGNDAEFKKQFKSFFKKDIFDNVPMQLVDESVKALSEAGYPSQVNPRPINCFYVEPGLRARIEKTGELFHLVGTERTLTKNELEKIIDDTPEKISPNVVLRPLYQQVILPNIAYIGGPGELAYWLEFKKMFDELSVVFPVLMPRNFLTVVDKTTRQRIEKLKLLVTDFFESEQRLIKKFMISSDQVFDLASEKEKTELIYSELIKKTTGVDPTLEKHVAAELTRLTKKLDGIALKANRALRKKADTELSRIKFIKQILFPNGIPQERSENFSALYLAYGPSIFEQIKGNIQPFTLDQKILVES